MISVWTPSSFCARTMPRCAESKKDLSPSVPFSTRIARSAGAACVAGSIVSTSASASSSARTFIQSPPCPQGSFGALRSLLEPAILRKRSFEHLEEPRHVHGDHHVCIEWTSGTLFAGRRGEPSRQPPSGLHVHPHGGGLR